MWHFWKLIASPPKIAPFQLLYCLQVYKGDEKIKTFIWDLITPSETGEANVIARDHSGLHNLVPRGRNAKAGGKGGKDIANTMPGQTPSDSSSPSAPSTPNPAASDATAKSADACGEATPSTSEATDTDAAAAQPSEAIPAADAPADATATDEAAGTDTAAAPAEAGGETPAPEATDVPTTLPTPAPETAAAPDALAAAAETAAVAGDASAAEAAVPATPGPPPSINDPDHWSKSERYDCEAFLEAPYKKHLGRHANK